ncbi:E3 ubiquitin-protein ligase Praja-1 [Brassica rapa]|nr:E3 ubiquitin-protein ligase Praja-1 [Brassica rapa]
MCSNLQVLSLRITSDHPKYTCKNLNGTFENPIFFVFLYRSFENQSCSHSSYYFLLHNSTFQKPLKSMAEFHLPPGIENEAEQENATFIDDEYLDYIHYLASRSSHETETFGSYDEIFGQVLGNSSSTRRPETAEELPAVNLTAEELTERGLVVCAICREKLAPSERLSELPCRHYYHKDCISSWLTNRNTCPLCRHNVRN